MDVAHQIPLSMEFSRQEYWSGLSFPPLGDLPDIVTEPMSPALTGGVFTMEPSREAQFVHEIAAIVLKAKCKRKGIIKLSRESFLFRISQIGYDFCKAHD